MNYSKIAIKSLFASLVLGGVGLFKCSYVIGSSFSFFSAANIFGPMTGLFGGSCVTAGALFIRQLVKVLLFNGSWLGCATYGIPTLCASAALQKRSFFFNIFLPAACMLAFYVHPTGGHAWLYSCLWIIPMLGFMSDAFAVRSLASTFIAHAVGSVIFLYTHVLPAEYWLALLPVALFERCAFAAGMTVVWTVYSGLRNKFPSITSSSIFRVLSASH